MSTTTDIRQRAIELIEQLPNSRLTAAINYLESLSQSSSEEAALLQIIQRCASMSPGRHRAPRVHRSRDLTVEEQKRLDELRVRSGMVRINRSRISRITDLRRLARTAKYRANRSLDEIGRNHKY